MKTNDVKEAMLQNGFSDELFEEFKNSLKHVPKGNRSQHLYTFAYEIAMEEDCFEGALEMIRYAMDFCENSWVDFMRAYKNLAAIYESRGMYAEAYEAYSSALGAVPEEQRADYIASISVRMIKAHLHTVNFSYTPHLRELYGAVLQMGDFEAEFREVIYYTAIAEMLISQNDANKEAYSRAKARALEALCEEKRSAMDVILARHKYKSEAYATKSSVNFLKKSKWKE